MNTNTRNTLTVALATWLIGIGFGSAQDMPLSQVLIEGEGWEVVSEGHDFTDGLCTDSKGNLYFADVKSGDGVFKTSLDGKTEKLFSGVEGISGLQWGADGKLYACVARQQRVISFSAKGEVTELAADVRPNDLVVAHDGNLYFTMTPAKEIRRIDPGGKMTVVSEGVVSKPNGISLSPDQGTLAVSDYGGKYVWAFRIEKDGSLNHAQNYMTMRTPVKNPEVAKGDGMATDIHGRYYVTSEMGLQMYDPTGRMGGVIAKPQNKPLVSVCFAGPNHEYLHVACGDKVYRRKTKTRGALYFQKPRSNEPPPKK